jgi:hypothetical protein
MAHKMSLYTEQLRSSAEREAIAGNHIAAGVLLKSMVNAGVRPTLATLDAFACSSDKAHFKKLLAIVEPGPSTLEAAIVAPNKRQALWKCRAVLRRGVRPTEGSRICPCGPETARAEAGAALHDDVGAGPRFIGRHCNPRSAGRFVYSQCHE